jgi:hypothetical protein
MLAVMDEQAIQTRSTPDAAPGHPGALPARGRATVGWARREVLNACSASPSDKKPELAIAHLRAPPFPLAIVWFGRN